MPIATRLLRSFALAALLATAACSDERTADVTTTSVASTSTTSTSTTSTTSTSSTSTTSTTIPAVEGLDPSAEGLGDLLFGANADDVVAYVDGILGGATNDTGWLDPVAQGFACPGTTVRFVTWHDLVLFFTDESPYSSGLRHFASFSYGPAMAVSPDPFGLATAEGIGIGSTVQDLRAAYPDAQVFEGDEIAGPSFFLDSGLSGFLTGATAADTVTALVGGSGCGE